MGTEARKRVAVACQGGGSHTAFTAGVLQGLLLDMPPDVDIVALSGTSGGAICAALAWEGLLREDPKRGCTQLKAFWESMAAGEPWDQLANQAMASVTRLRELSLLPEVSPYHVPTWGEDRFREALERFLDFDELRKLANKPGAPILKVGAVEVLSGRFEVFRGEELNVECLMASAAIPELFRAITVPGRGVYWDGLFSQNPPVRDLLVHDPDEIWVIQINSVACAKVPTETHEILDRRNELAGNLSLMQELAFIDAINRAIERGVMTDPRYKIVRVERIYLDRALHYRTKLDRRPEFIRELMQYGQTKWHAFARDRTDETPTQKASQG
jgi:NTE family protein